MTNTQLLDITIITTLLTKDTTLVGMTLIMVTITPKEDTTPN